LRNCVDFSVVNIAVEFGVNDLVVVVVLQLKLA